MAERVVKVRLSAVVEDYKKNMADAANATRAVGTQAEKLAQQRQAFNMLGTAGVAMGAAIAAGIGVAVSRFAEFDQAMSFVAATGEDARGSLDELRQAALDAGADTVFSATEAANAIEEMAKAGLSAKDILGGGLTGALDLAAAGGLGVADAAGIAATALKTFNLEGSDMSHVADLLAAGAGKAMGDVSDLSAALNQTALVANSTGLSIEETTAGLAAFASQGLLGSDAGTSFKTMLGALTPNSAKAADEMKRLGISAYDAGGRFIGLEAFAGQLQTRMAGLTDEQRNASLEIMFGSDAVRAATVLYSEGESGIRDWIAAVDDQGYAAETAATRLDNLIGDWEKFTGALDTAFITMGEGANGPLRALVQGLTGLVDGFNTLPDWAQQASVGVALLAAGVGLVGGAVLLAVPKVAELKIALETLGVSAARTSRLMGLLGRAGVVAGVVGVFALATAAANELGNALSDAIGPSAEEVASKTALAKSGVELFYAALQRRDYLGSIDEVPGLFGMVGDALEDAADNADEWWNAVDPKNSDTLSTIRSMGEELANLAKTDISAASAQFRTFADDAGLTERQITQALREMPGFRDELVKAGKDAGVASDDISILNFVMDEGADVATSAADAYMEQADTVSELNDQLLQLIEAMNEANGVGQDAVSQNIRFEETLAAVNQAIADGASGLDIGTEAGRKNMDMLVGLAADAQSAAAAQLELDGSTEAYIARMNTGREALINSAIAMGATRDEAVALANKIYAIPSEKDIKVLADTASAEDRLRALKERLDSIPNNSYKRVTLESFSVGKFDVTPNANGGYYSGGVKAFAGGGFEPGIYPYAAGGIHKFAEAYDEAYISLDPSRRDRSEAVWVKTGQEMGMFSGPSAQLPPIYIQSPVTGEYLLAKTSEIASGVVAQYDSSRSLTSRGGVRP
ncbi:phage tail tape measure protein [Microbacterium oxydans]|uniref:phage tail tape measure protein n=1 Tax=Microbacterium oxydans TaxID=82380 RepID=UPI0037CCA306